ISLGLLAFRITTCAPRARAASCTVAVSVAVWATLAGLTRTAIVEPGDIRLCISSKHFLNSSTFRLVTPVMLPPGWGRLATRQMPPGSVPTAKTIGIVGVAPLAAREAGVLATT